MEMVTAIDYKAFSKAFNAFPIEAAKELRLEMKGASKAVMQDAKLHHRFKRKSGMLDRSINYTISESGLSSEVFLDDGVASYGKWVHDGTPPHIIRAKGQKALMFVMGGVKFMVPKTPHKVPGWMIKAGMVGGGDSKTKWSQKGFVNHPGTKPDKFLYQAAGRQKPYFIARINGAINRVIEAAGLK